MPQPILQFLYIPALVNKHRSTTMSQLMQGDFRSTKSLCSFSKRLRNIVGIILTSIFPCKYISILIFIIILVKFLIYRLFIPYSLQTAFSCRKQVQCPSSRLAFCRIICLNRFDTNHSMINSNCSFLIINCFPFQPQNFRTAQPIISGKECYTKQTWIILREKV